MSISSLRKTLIVGSLVFGISSVFLLIAPAIFLHLLGMDISSQLQWSMRMIGITVFALAGNMWNNAKQADDSRVINVARIMCVSAALLGILTLLLPSSLTWFAYLYAIIGFSFSAAYLFNLVKKSR